MRLTAIVFLYFSIGIMSALLGFPTPAFDLLSGKTPTLTLTCPPEQFGGVAANQSNNFNFTTENNMSAQAFSKCTSTGTILGSFAFWLFIIGISALLLNFSAMYIIPYVLMFAILSLVGYLFVPIAQLTATAPFVVQLGITSFFNIINILFAVSFIRGGQV